MVTQTIGSNKNKLVPKDLQPPRYPRKADACIDTCLNKSIFHLENGLNEQALLLHSWHGPDHSVTSKFILKNTWKEHFR